MKLKQLNKKISQSNKAIQSFLKQTLKNYKTMKARLKKNWLLLAVFIMYSCGTTKVSVHRPDNGTYTQITVTTNNPITTNTDADASAELNTKGK